VGEQEGEGDHAREPFQQACHGLAWGIWRAHACEALSTAYAVAVDRSFGVALILLGVTVALTEIG
jgi:hypothetical protein